jgi:hypothetical protein
LEGGVTTLLNFSQNFLLNRIIAQMKGWVNKMNESRQLTPRMALVLKVNFLRANRFLVATFQTLHFLFNIFRGKKVTEISSPAWYKRYILLRLIRINHVDVFIETGTYLGQTSELIHNRFNSIQVLSIEIDEDLHRNATRRLKRELSGGRLKLILGDSSAVLLDHVGDTESRLFVFLDGHFSSGITTKYSDCPLIVELNSIINKRDRGFTLIAIDDVHYFDKRPDYPTWKFIMEFCKKHNFSWSKKGSLLILNQVSSEEGTFSQKS